MFSLYSRSRLYSLGEIVMPWRFWWRSAPGVFQDWDFAARNLRSTRWLHMRVDADYNGWFMCLIPTRCSPRSGCRCRCSSSGTTPSTACAPRPRATRR